MSLCFSNPRFISAVASAAARTACKTAAAAAAAIACAASVHAQTQAPNPNPNLKPGQYEYATITEVFGIKIPVNFKQCVTQKDVDSNNAYVNKQGTEGCTPPDVKRKGAEITIKYSCTKPKMTGEGKGTVSSEMFTMEMRVSQFDENGDMRGSAVKTMLTAKRLGDCAK